MTERYGPASAGFEGAVGFLFARLRPQCSEAFCGRHQMPFCPASTDLVWVHNGCGEKRLPPCTVSCSFEPRDAHLGVRFSALLWYLLWWVF